ncbi:hypothetical protein CHS0354_029394 [Potamilus streckersoni]|uniref:Uncharacterized protein n=1 Tax=Potamilus streckersoni TaxID=2493646 RepID=A0AAE0STU2_9BIVA|nr:hypothetical protein CHS0354_029394 [Potamilus streckersoni]
MMLDVHLAMRVWLAALPDTCRLDLVRGGSCFGGLTLTGFNGGLRLVYATCRQGARHGFGSTYCLALAATNIASNMPFYSLLVVCPFMSSSFFGLTDGVMIQTIRLLIPRRQFSKNHGKFFPSHGFIPIQFYCFLRAHSALENAVCGSNISSTLTLAPHFQQDSVAIPLFSP